MYDQLTPPADPIAAVTHADPYPYYARLVEERPLYRDEQLGCWVASSAEAVTAVLTSDAFRVRPPSEPVPAALAGTTAGELFSRLVRMNDRDGRCGVKQAATGAIDSIATLRIERATDGCARSLLGSGRDIASYCYQLPARVMATLLGVDVDDTARIAEWVGHLAACFSPAVSADERERGEVAARRLVAFFRTLIADPESPDGILKALAGEMHRAGCDDLDVAIANGIGFVLQAYDATAGLIANTFLAMARRDCERPSPEVASDAMQDVVREVMRYDSPVQNTRRYVAAPGLVLGQPVAPGDVILVILAAASRDPQANPDPTTFDVRRKHRRVFTFGAGRHACPGEMLATLIASRAVDRALSCGVDLQRIGERIAYRPSANVRIPIFDGKVFMRARRPTAAAVRRTASRSVDRG